MLTGYLVAIVIAGGIGAQVFAKFDSGGYSDPNSDSAKAWEYLEETFKVKDPTVVLIVKSKEGVDDPSVRERALRLEAELRAEKSAETVVSYWSTNAPSLRSSDGKSAFIFIYLRSSDFSKIDSAGGYYQSKYDRDYEGLDIDASGTAVFANAINGKIQDDLKLAEAISIPITFILLLLIFGAMVASAMPLMVGVTAILGTFFALFLLTFFTDVSIFALNLTTGLGLGLGIDYALLMVNRFREELWKGSSKEEAVATTIKTAGKTVFYSGITVILTLASMTFFPQNFFKSMGYSGVAVVALAVAGALIPLPAIMMILGARINKGLIRKSSLVVKDDGGWAKLARFVMRKPISVVIATTIGLGILIAPIADIKFSLVDSRVLPASDPAAASAAFIADNFPGQESNPIEIIFPTASDELESIERFRSQLPQLEGIVRVDQLTQVGEAARLVAIHSMPPRTPEAEKLIADIRELLGGIDALVGGVAADYADTQGATARTLPYVLIWILTTVLILLFLFTGSILLPIKAILLNFASLAATMGVLTYIFINGHLTFLVGDFTVTGTLDTSTVILIAIVAFGLSMDYEVFLLSRIKEEYENGRNNEDAVAFGLQRSARIITAAALLLATVFGIFVISGVTSIKMMGFGVAFAILLDATVIRGLLVPALMRLFGEWNWWAPKSLRRFRIDHA
ncbi:MAG: MMPL family transporter [Actinobacteria bacterium]|nr:MMPL family transporter [Actinomycetota bacterium]